MEFAINFSTQAVVLFAQERLKIDRFKTPGWPNMIAEAGQFRPVAVHFNLNAGRGRPNRQDLEQVYRLAEQTGTPYINVHLEAKASDFPGIPKDTRDPAQIEKVYRRAYRDLMRLVERFGAARVILENVPYHLAGNVMRPLVEPELITRLVEESDCGLLLDVAHARITAFHLDMDVREYLNRLPVRRLKEMHFTGVQDLDGRLQDHLPAQEEDWRNLEWVLAQIHSGAWPSPWMLAFEYGGVGERFIWRSSAQVMEAEGNRLYRLIKPI